MKGIKECLNFMLDNPNKIIKAEGYTECRFNYNKQQFEYKSSSTDKWYCLDGDDFIRFNEIDWQEVIEPVDFITAYNDCLENENVYASKSDNRQQIYKSENGVNLHYNHTWGNIFNLNGNWIKVG